MADYDGGSASVRIRPNMARFTTDLDADLRRVQATLEVACRVGNIDDADLQAWRGMQEANDVSVRVTTDTSAADRAIANLSSSHSGLARQLGVPLLLSVGMAGIDPAIAALGALSTSVLQLAEAGLVLPGIIGGAIASIGTFKVGIEGVSDAYDAVIKSADGSAASIKAADDAMASLAPNAQAFLREFIDIKGEFEDNEIQQNLFAGWDEGLRGLFDNSGGILKSGMESIATGLNDNISTLFDSLGSDQGQGILERILGNTSETQTRISAAIDPIVRAVGTLTAAGTDTLPRLADAITDASNRFATWIETADQDGSLAGWMDEGITAAGDFLGILGNLGDSFASIARNAGGEGLLGTIERLTGEWSDWLDTAEGQREVAQFFDDAREAAAEWLPILGDLPGMIGGVIDAGRTIGEVVLPPLQTIADVLADYPWLLEAAISAFVFTKAMTGVQALADAMSVGLPGAANKGAVGIAGALSRVAVPAWLAFLVASNGPDIEQQIANFIPGGQTFNNLPNPGDAGKAARDWVDSTVAVPPIPAMPGTAPGVAPSTIIAPGPAIQPPPGADSPTSNNPFFLPGYATGGYTDWESSQGRPALLHGREFVQQASAVAKYGVPFMNAVNEGRLPAFEGGGYIDQYGNPVTGGMLPGPLGGPAPQQPGGGGGLMSAFGSLLSGLQAPIGNALSLGSGLLQTPGSAGDASSTPAGPYNGFSSQLAAVPGLIGLLGGMGGSNPGADLMQWGSNTGDWLGNFAANTFMEFGSTLYQGALGMFGLENSILSPNNQYNQAFQQGLGYYGDLSGDLMGQSGSAGGASGALDPKKLREAQDKITDADTNVAVTQARLGELSADADESQRIYANAQLEKAKREAGQARLDFGVLQQGGPSRTGAVLPGGANPYVATLQPGQTVSMDTVANWPRLYAPGGDGQAPVVPAALQGFVKQFGSGSLTAGTRDDGGTLHQAGFAFDISGDPGDMQALSEYVRDNLSGSTLQLIYSGIRGNGELAAGGRVGPGYYNGHSDHVHWAIAPGMFRDGGHTGGNPSDPIPAILHGNEFVQRSSAVQKYGVEFMAALNEGRVDPNMLPQYAIGGYVQEGPARAYQAAMRYAPTPPPRPRPDFDPGAGARQLDPQPNRPTPATPPRESAAPPAALPPEAAAPPAEAATPGRQAAPAPGFQLNAPPPSSTDHNLPGVDMAIESTASTLGSIAAQAASMGMAAGGGGAGAGGVGSMIQGGAQQVGKIAKNVVNVLSSFGVGNVTMGDPTAPVYGTVGIPAQRQPDTWAGGGGGNRTYTAHGLNTRDVIREFRIMDAEDQQGHYANV
ncbi:hypothetical protein BH11ACT6_BH11ACT6_34960 [soil metagenome]